MKGFFSQFKRHFLYAGLFSFFDNMLLLAMPLYMMQLFDRVMTSRSNETLIMLSIAAVGALLVMWVLETLRARLLGSASILMDQALGGKVVSGLIKSAARLGSRDYAQGLRDVAVLRGFLTGNSIFSLFDAPWAIFFLIIIFMMHPLMGAVALIGAILLFLVAYANQKLTQAPLHEASLASRKSSKFIDSSIRNAEVVSAMGMVNGVRGRWQRMNELVLEQQQALTQRTSVIIPFTKFLRQFIQIAMYCAGAYLVIDQHMTPGIMIAATLILARALSPVEQAITTWKGFVDARESYDSLSKLLSDYKEDAAAMSLPEPTGQLSVEKMAFVTSTTRFAVIKGISFELQAGEVLGVIGPSAAGKSSLLRLIAGIWKPTAGAVRMDGADLSEWPREHIGEHIGYLPHDVELFAGSVGDNIARLLPAKDFSEQVIEAAKMAGVHDLILRLPNGYETDIGETGYVLSGGQRQRVALARALFNKPRLILLDEPNANLDGEGEIAFLNAVLAMKQEGMTVIIVTHKPAMLAHADKVLVMREGLVETFGPRNEVISRAVRTTGSGANIQAVGA